MHSRLYDVLAGSVPMTSNPRELLGTDTQAHDGVQPLLSLDTRSQKPWSSWPHPVETTLLLLVTTRDAQLRPCKPYLLSISLEPLPTSSSVAGGSWACPPF